MNQNLLYILITLISICSCKGKSYYKVERKEIIDVVFASGKVETLNEYNITSQTEGYLKTNFIEEGDSIKTNQPLFELVNDIQQIQVNNAWENYLNSKVKTNNNSPQIEKLKYQINLAKENKNIDSVNLNRYEKLIKTNAVSRLDYDKIKLQYLNDLYKIKLLYKSLSDLEQTLELNKKNAKAQYLIEQKNNNFFTFKSIGEGIVLNIFKKIGDLVKRGETIARIGNGEIIATLNIAEEDIKKIQEKQVVYITLNTDKDKIYDAIISKIYPNFDDNIQSFIVQATFLSPLKLTLNGTQLQANIIINKKATALVIPKAYLLFGDSVITKIKHQKTALKTGINTLEWVEVLSGLTENEIIELPN